MAVTAESGDLETLRRDIAGLKRQFADLVRHGRAAAASSARRAYRDLSERGESAANLAGDQVRRAPLTSVAVAFLVGCVAGRLVR
jgi:ElaB/YqjD/DUF883 family membrane-anchored ribosome-binding protein